MPGATTRIYLTGQLAVETTRGLADTRMLPGRQGRRAFVYLVLERNRPMPFAELAEAVWGAPEIPTGWEAALSAIVSKIRRFLGEVVVGGTISSSDGCYAARLGSDVWIDVDAAVAAVDQAEAYLRRGDWPTAMSHASVAQAIARSPFLPADEGAWVEAQRARLQQVLLRAWDAVAQSALASGQYGLAIDAATQSLARDRLRESSYQLLMRAQAASGNRAAALRTYDTLRRELADELGVDPSPGTESVYLELLRA